MQTKSMKWQLSVAVTTRELQAFPDCSSLVLFLCVWISRGTSGFGPEGLGYHLLWLPGQNSTEMSRQQSTSHLVHFVVWLVFQEHCIQQQHPLIRRFLNEYLERDILIITKDKLVHAHIHSLCQPLNLILVTLLHHRFCEGPRVITGGEMSYIPVLVWWRMEKSLCYGVCLFYLFIPLTSLSLQTQSTAASLQLAED